MLPEMKKFICDINNLIIQIFRLAQHMGKCEYQEYGRRIIRDIPKNILIKVIVLSLKDDILDFLRSAYCESDIDVAEKFVLGYISKCLTKYFVTEKNMTDLELQEGEELVDIKGFQEPDDSRWISSFFAYIFSEILWQDDEKLEMEIADKLYEVHIQYIGGADTIITDIWNKDKKKQKKNENDKWNMLADRIREKYFYDTGCDEKSYKAFKRIGNKFLFEK